MAGVAWVALIAGACGDDDDGGSNDEASPPASAAPAAVDIKEFKYLPPRRSSKHKETETLMEITEHELRSMAADVDDLHHAAMRTFREETAELHLGAVHSRRRFLVGSAVGAGALGAVLAVGPGFLAPSSMLPKAFAQGITDADIAAFAESVELAAVAAYAFALTALTLAEAIAGTATILPVESAHAGVIGAAVGKGLPEMFPTDAFLPSQVGDGTDPNKGLDPAKFPVG